jgi:kinetochore protein Nuf2
MQPVFVAMDAFEFPELHDESIPTNNFFKQLSKLLTACGVKDFRWGVSGGGGQCGGEG